MGDSIAFTDKLASADADCFKFVAVLFVFDVNNNQAPKYFQSRAEG